MQSPENRLIILGIDGLELSMLEELKNELPNLSKVMDQGVVATVDVKRPILSPVVWTEYASGYPAEIHGIGGWTNQAGHPYTSADVRTWRIWDSATEAGVSITVSGYLMSWPVTPVKGTMLTDRFVWSFPMDKPHDQELMKIDESQHDVLKGTIWPPEAENIAFSLIPDENWLSVHYLSYQVESYGNPFHPLQRDETHLRYLEETFDNLPGSGDQAQIGICYLQGIDQVSHLYWPFTQDHLLRQMRLNPQDRVDAIKAAWQEQGGAKRPYPFPEGASRQDLDQASRWVPDEYRYMDEAVGRVMALLSSSDTLVILSDHGFRASPSQPLIHGSHGDKGLFMAIGSQVGEPEKFSMNELDVGPTLLALAGLPVAEDMPGGVRGDLFQVEPPKVLKTRVLQRVDTVPSADLSGSFSQMKQQLEALGYIDQGGKPIIGASRKRVIVENQ